MIALIWLGVAIPATCFVAGVALGRKIERERERAT